MKTVLATALLVVSVAAHAKAETATDGNWLLSSCAPVVKSLDGGGQKMDDAFAMGQCMGMLEGVSGSAQILSTQLPETMKTCLPQSYNNGQGVRVVVKYLRDHPKDLNLPASFLVMMSLKTAFPCS